MSIKIVGLDMAFSNTGVVVADYTPETGLIAPSSLHLIETEKGTNKSVRRNSDDLARASHLRSELMPLLSGARVVFVEVPTGSQSARASWCLGIALGIMTNIVDQPMIQVAPRETKLATVGRVTASKEEMIQWAHGRYPHLNWIKRKLKGEQVLQNSNEHLADAIGVVHAGIKTPEFQDLMRMARSLSFLA